VPTFPLEALPSIVKYVVLFICNQHINNYWEVTFLFEALNKTIRIVENIICSVGLILTTLIIFAQVINRYWLHFEVMWMNDMALYIFVSTVFITLALATRERGHIGVEILQEKFLSKAPRFRKAYLFIRGIVSLVVVGIFSFPVYHFLLRSIKYPEYGTLIRWFNTSWIVYCFFIMICLMIFHLIIQIGEDFYDLKDSLRSREASKWK